MRIIVMSDSHGNFSAVRSIVEKNLGHADMFIHLGDGEKDVAHIKSLYPEIDFRNVRGNCDTDEMLPDSDIIEADGVKIFSHTHHIPLRKALEEITYEKILDTIIRVDSLTVGCSVFDHDKPLAIASVNPHHADSLSYDEEESEVLIPAIKAARSIGIDIIGPVSGDHLMHRAKKGLYRAVITLFHDQAHIAAMSFDFEHTVTVTWGWPFISVGVDRGAMLERAGKNIMEPYNLIQALYIASK